MYVTKKIEALPFIVNRCDGHKQREFEFSDLNFDQLKTKNKK